MNVFDKLDELKKQRAVGMDEFRAIRIIKRSIGKDTLYSGFNNLAEVRELLRDPETEFQLISTSHLLLMVALDLGSTWDKLLASPVLMRKDENGKLTWSEEYFKWIEI